MLKENLDRLIYDIIEEAIPDIERATTNTMNQHVSEFIMRSQSNGMISGIDIIQRIVEIVNDSIEIKIINGSGSIVEKGDIIAIFRGNTNTLLHLRPLMQTVVEHLSRVATIVYQFRSNVQDTNTHIYAHNVFTPLFQPFEKYAFEQAGGLLLEQSFSHLELLSKSYIPVSKTLNQMITLIRKSIDHQLIIGVIVDTDEEYFAAIRSECDIIVLCDFSLDKLTTHLQLDAPEYIRIVRGSYDVDELNRINHLHPDGILVDSLQDLETSFHIAIEQTR
jgi:nicotinate-nucleotide pyrophosphorylase (carboxylating)